MSREHLPANRILRTVYALRGAVNRAADSDFFVLLLSAACSAAILLSLRVSVRIRRTMALDRLRAHAQRRLRALAASRRARRLLLRAALVATVAPVLLQLLVAYVVGSDARLLPPALLQAQNLLIITAHPDDECLFFAPSVLGVLDRNRSAKGGLLAFSTGQLLARRAVPRPRPDSALHREQLRPRRPADRRASGLVCGAGHRRRALRGAGPRRAPGRPARVVG